MSVQDFETVVGLECHVELATATKMFCGCRNEFGAPPNSNVCPICLGHPGTLPVPNQSPQPIQPESAYTRLALLGMSGGFLPDAQ